MSDYREYSVSRRDKEPLLTLPLKEISSKQQWPIELNLQGEAERPSLQVSILGRYQAMLPVSGSKSGGQLR